jgi:hypothetical protein
MLLVPAETSILNQIKSYRGNEFQDFGDRLLSKLYPDEYIAVRAGGNLGDLKNDGYCHIKRIFFHFYGNTQHNVNTLKAKITSDIEGCLAKQQQVEKIVYVTNDANLGVIEAHIDALRLKHQIAIDTWGPNRLVEILRTLSVYNLAAVLKWAIQDDVTSIKYEIIESSIKVYTKKMVNIRIAISGLSFAGFFFAFFYLFIPLPFLWWFLTIFALFTLFVLYNWSWSLPVNTHLGKEWQRGSLFYCKEGNIYKEYQKYAVCPYPNCNGIIQLGEPPKKETNRFKGVGYCSANRTIHTFSINEENIGYPVTLNFESGK